MSPAPQTAGGLLMVYGRMDTGGIETLIVRLANVVTGRGTRVAVCTSGGPLLDRLDPGVERLDYADESKAIDSAAAWLEANGPATILSFDPISAALALDIETRAGAALAPTHLSGVFHPRAYFMTGSRKDRIALNRLVARAVGDERLFFMNEEARDEHGRVLGVGQGSAILPLPIAEQPAQWSASTRPALRLVSVGRLVDFKAFVLAIPGIVRDLAAQGIDARWDIYGDGPLKGELEGLIAASRSDRVRLLGLLPYENFAATVAGYDLFVGMGTAALEAAMLGVPTIVATESSASTSHGYLHDLPFGNVGERRTDLPAHELGEMIARFAALGEDGRAALSEASRAAARRFSTDHFLAALEALGARTGENASPLRKRVAAALYRLATRSAGIRLARRLRALARSGGAS
ncbi:glycosyltransferase [Sphingomonas astaxanthinifaciens]|uniref:Uncharacterized protein n=1 Tax=Sphingomonas astaxanthinifaciens DSM 22298 TaxID=1123267 RepID=A0ABQ5Z4P7_9SPHN|nr:glycosyltransferase [Sphingomonas astaxanthinifaciens]GLR46971.1 hypothetical protein GCM10007925_06820 [Sphingomonas astaxanthinifaciens DSM 22298]